MTNENASLTARYEAIIATCDASLARISASNTMRSVIDGNRARAVAEIAYINRNAR